RPSAQSAAPLPANSRYLLTPALDGWTRLVTLINVDSRRLDIAVAGPRITPCSVPPGKTAVVDVGAMVSSETRVLEAHAAGKYAAYVALTSPDRRKLEIADSIGETARRHIFPMLVRRAPAVTTITLF